MAYTVNSSKSIVWVDGSGNTHNITRVVYCDNWGTPHDVWPKDAELDKVYLVRITQEANGSTDATSLKNSDEYVEFHMDSNGEPTVTLLPYHSDFKNNRSKHNVYALKGDVKIHETENGVRTGNYTMVTDCYFWAETTETEGDGVPIYFDGTTKYGPRLNSSYDGVNPGWNWPGYVTITVDDRPGESKRVEPQCGYHDRNVGYVQLGYIFDPNYNTRMVIKRATVREALILTDSASSTNPSSYSSVLGYGDEITVYPKIRRYATSIGWTNNDYERYFQPEQNEITIDYDHSILSITANNNGSYTITPLLNSGVHNDEVTFNYNNGESLAEIQLTTVADHSYVVYDTGHVSPQSSYTLVSPKTFTVNELDWDGSIGGYTNEHYYSGDIDTTTSNSSAVTVSGNGKTVTPVTTNVGATSTITMSKNGDVICQFTVTVGQLQTVAYDVTDGVSDMSEIDAEFKNIHSNTLSNGNLTEEFTNCYNVQNNHKVYFGIKFGTSNSFDNLMTVYIDTDGEACLYDENDRQVEVYNGGGGLIYFGFTKNSGQNLVVDIPVCSDPNYQNLLGTIHLTVYN